MKVYLLTGGQRVPCRIPHGGAWAEAAIPCPHCGTDPLRAVGTSPQISADDRAYEATAHCMACQGHVGTLRLEMDTLFGVTEDGAVLGGRARVY